MFSYPRSTLSKCAVLVASVILMAETGISTQGNTLYFRMPPLKIVIQLQFTSLLTTESSCDLAAVGWRVYIKKIIHNNTEYNIKQMQMAQKSFLIALTCKTRTHFLSRGFVF